MPTNADPVTSSCADPSQRAPITQSLGLKRASRPWVGALIDTSHTLHLILWRARLQSYPSNPLHNFDLSQQLRPCHATKVLKPDGMLSEDEDAALRRTIAALVLNLRGIDPDLRESGLDVLSTLATRRSAPARL